MINIKYLFIYYNKNIHEWIYLLKFHLFVKKNEKLELYINLKQNKLKIYTGDFKKIKHRYVSFQKCIKKNS